MNEWEVSFSVNVDINSLMGSSFKASSDLSTAVH